jgi:hypothetical protein
MNCKSRFKKIDALKETANASNTTPDKADRKRRNINSQYLRDRHIYRKKEKKKKNSRAEKQFHAKWFGYSLMGFLRDRNKPWFQASAAILMRSALFWGVTQRPVRIFYRRFGTTYRSHLQRSRSPLPQS